MSTSTAHAPPDDESIEPTDQADVDDRLRRLEGEVVELRKTLTDLADIVVGDIQDRREIAAAISAPPPEVQIPASLVPGGEATMTAIAAIQRPWLLFDLARDFWVAGRMYMDPRYRIRRGTQLMVPAIITLLVATYLLFHVLLVSIPILSQLVEYLCIGVLAVVLYKVVSREVARYRQMLLQLGVVQRGAGRAIPASILHPDPDTTAHVRQETG